MPDWNELFASPRNVLDEPEALARDMSATLPPGSRVLDLGCGAGRHLALLAGDGHRAIGMDNASRGLTRSRERLTSRSLPAYLVLGDFRLPLPFPDAVFQAVLAIKSVNHATAEEVQVAFSEIHRVLLPGGRLVGTVISTLDARYGDGRQVGPHTFVHDRPPEAGVVHHYFTEGELRNLLIGFSFLDLSLTERLVGPEEPIFGSYRFRGGLDPVLRHWNFRAIL